MHFRVHFVVCGAFFLVQRLYEATSSNFQEKHYWSLMAQNLQLPKIKTSLGVSPSNQTLKTFSKQTSISDKRVNLIVEPELPPSPLTCNIFFLSLYLLSSKGSETFPSGETCCSCRSRDDKNVTCIKQVNHEQWGQGASGFSPERKQETLRKQQKRALPHRFPGATRANANVPAYHCPYSLLYSHSLVLSALDGWVGCVSSSLFKYIQKCIK